MDGVWVARESSAPDQSEGPIGWSFEGMHFLAPPIRQPFSGSWQRSREVGKGRRAQWRAYKGARAEMSGPQL